MKHKELPINPSGDEDRSLITDFLSGENPRAFDRLLDKHKNMIYHLCFHMLGNHEEAEDCSQETFIKVYKSLSRFRFQSSFSTWLYRIAVNTCKNKLSSLEHRTRKNFLHLDRPVETEEGFTRVELSSPHSPEDEVEQREFKNHIMNAIKLLPTEQKILIFLRDIEGMSYEEISQITDRRLGTVKSGLARARHFLRLKLEGVMER